MKETNLLGVPIVLQHSISVDYNKVTQTGLILISAIAAMKLLVIAFAAMIGIKS